MSEFEFWETAYKFGWASEADLESAVALGLLTAEQKLAILNS